MKWFRIAAVMAALSAASYAQAQVPEGRLGEAVGAASGPGKPAPSSVAGPLSRLGDGVGPSRLGRALARVRPDAQSVTRGATETNVYRRASPAVVLVVAKEGFGSGVLISADGRIVTNLHVVEDAAEVGVVFKPAQEGAAVGKADIRRARVLLRDELTDLALIQVAEVPPGVAPLQLGNSTTLEVGADVHAIGHPTGENWTYTKGIVSQIRRAYAWRAADGIPHEATVIQTQTPINPGNSGGPLLDDNLNVVGINSFVGEGEGLNFAVSAEDVKTFLSRREDRMTRDPGRVAAGGRCEPKAIDERASTKPKGREFLMDQDCDGKGDSMVVVPASKREPVAIYADDDGDGKFDTLYLDDGQDGKLDLALADTDGNGKPDMRGHFRNGEDEPYRWEKIQE